MDDTEEPDDAFAYDDNVQETDGEDTKDEPLTDLSAEREITRLSKHLPGSFCRRQKICSTQTNHSLIHRHEKPIL